MASIDITEQEISKLIANYYKSIDSNHRFEKITSMTKNNPNLCLSLDGALQRSVVNNSIEHTSDNNFLIKGYLILPYTLFGCYELLDSDIRRFTKLSTSLSSSEGTDSIGSYI